MSNKSFSCPFVSCALERLNSDQSTPVPIIQHTDQTEILQGIIVSYTTFLYQLKFRLFSLPLKPQHNLTQAPKPKGKCQKHPERGRGPYILALCTLCKPCMEHGACTDITGVMTP